MPINVQVLKANTLNIPNGLYLDWMGNSLSDGNANTLISEGAARLSIITAPSVASIAGTSVNASSGNVAAAAAVATLPAVASRTTYITGFEITGAGATAGSVVLATLTGLLGGTATYAVAVPAGVLVGVTPLVVQFSRPMPASAVNTAITLTLPSLGAGNTNAAVVAHGFSL